MCRIALFQTVIETLHETRRHLLRRFIAKMRRILEAIEPNFTIGLTLSILIYQVQDKKGIDVKIPPTKKPSQEVSMTLCLDRVLQLQSK